MTQRASRKSGSIPACAGPPVVARLRQWESWVYPRVCGATHEASRENLTREGLSPRVRGHLRCAPGEGCRERSIPACAGASLSGCGPRCRSEVYPRVCWGIFGFQQISSASRGLSPRVRGHLIFLLCRLFLKRSIPACAGASKIDEALVCVWEVYPRVCGGITNHDKKSHNSAGLSPRVRGHHEMGAKAALQTGSIPACAGASRSRHTVTPG